MKELINLIFEEHGDDVKITQEQAEIIADFVMTELREDARRAFIIEDLHIFDTKDKAFNWFFNYDGDGTININYIDVEITEDMVGRNLKDIMLENQQNYQEIAKLHLVWWM